MNSLPSMPTDADLEQLLSDSRELVDAPAHVVHRAIGVFQPRTRPSLLNQVLAVLRFDSAASSPLAFGLRSGATPSRQMLYACEGRDIDLRLVAAADGSPAWDLRGQLLGPDIAGMAELANLNDARQIEVPLSELAEFHFTALSAGEYRLLLRLPQIEISLPPFAVPGESSADA